jgi:sulfite exporter TauE/SafE
MTNADLATALLMGLAGAGHCIGMCGGIASAIGLSSHNRPALPLAYHAGRIGSYALIGAALGAVASTIQMDLWRILLRYAAALMLIAMGLYTANWWLGLRRLESAGSRLWQPIQKLTRPLLPAKHAHQAFLLGTAWGFLPCGLIYSALAWSSTQANPLNAGLLMALFGIGTLPAMLTTSLGAQWLTRWLNSQAVRRSMGAGLIAWGLFNLAMLIRHSLMMHSA